MRHDRVLDTRQRLDGTLIRRRERPDGTRYTTAEMPAEVWRALRFGGKDRYDSPLAALSDRIVSLERMVCRQMYAAGASKLSIQRATGLPWRQVTKYLEDTCPSEPTSPAP